MKSTDDQEHMPLLEVEWISAVMVLTLPLAIFAVALGCSFFV
ncbi:hypothetical protein [Rhizobium tubonense]|nr:hypothetical protein [Rhizobium tubonense]